MRGTTALHRALSSLLQLQRECSTRLADEHGPNEFKRGWHY